ncbi:helix-turn-helix transcriptional regulator [Lachnospiraceae bacterium 50-23]
MGLGNNLFNARKKKGMSQEAVAEKLGVSRQTISKWETDETLPDIRQSKRLAVLYDLSLDELIDSILT